MKITEIDVRQYEMAGFPVSFHLHETYLVTNVYIQIRNAHHEHKRSRDITVRGRHESVATLMESRQKISGNVRENVLLSKAPDKV